MTNPIKAIQHKARRPGVALVGVMLLIGLSNVNAESMECPEHGEVREITGTLSSYKFVQGEKQLQRRFDQSSLASLSESERCLSRAASWAGGFPVLVVDKPTGHDSEVEVIQQVAPDMANSKALIERLVELDAGYVRPNEQADPQAYEYHQQFPARAKREAIEGTAYQINFDHRSTAIPQRDHCLMVRDTSDFAEYVMGRTSQVGQGLNGELREWVDDYANAAEFWHEVGHCRFHGDRTGLSADVESLDVMDAGQGRAQQSLACDVSADEAAEDSERHRQSEQSISSDDRRLLVTLTEESAADTYAMQRIRQLHDQRLPGCRSGAINNELHQLRLAMAMQWPRAQYMGWLLPTIANEPANVAAQVASDAWTALERLAANKGRSDGGQFRQHSTAVSMPTPTLPPDEQRVQQWESWLEGELRRIVTMDNDD